MRWCLRFRSSTDSRTSSYATEKGIHRAHCAENPRSHSAVLGWSSTFLRSCSDNFKQFSDRRVCKTVQKTDEFPQLPGCGRRCAHAATSESASDEFIDELGTILRSGFRPIFTAFLASVHPDVEAQLGPLDGKQLLVVEGSRWRGTPRV